VILEKVQVASNKSQQMCFNLRQDATFAGPVVDGEHIVVVEATVSRRRQLGFALLNVRLS
jgi:hypothetical protein